jgi:hypothetical protein
MIVKKTKNGVDSFKLKYKIDKQICCVDKIVAHSSMDPVCARFDIYTSYKPSKNSTIERIEKITTSEEFAQELKNAILS